MMEAFQYLHTTHIWSMIMATQKANRQNIEMLTEKIVQMNQDCSGTDDQAFSAPVLQKKQEHDHISKLNKREGSSVRR